jgi:CBS domain-containing protein
MEGFRMARLQAATFGFGSKTSTTQEIGAALARQVEAAGERLQTLATQLREALPADGAALLGEGLESARRYLDERDLRDLGRDVADLVRRYPVQAVLFGAGAGFVVSRLRGGRGASGLRSGSGARLKDVMTRHVEVVRPDATLREAAAKMADLDVGTIPVCDGDRLVGMISDRDITIRATARGADTSTPVREIMSSIVRYGFEDEPVEHAMETMKRRKIRRLPVLDGEKRLVGIVSLGDLAVEADAQKAGQVLERVSAASPTR